jgi:hypothetical protein
MEIDGRLHSALVYLKWLQHMGYLLDYWLAYDDIAISQFIDPVVHAIIEGK